MVSSSMYAFFHCHYAFQKFPFFCIILCVLHALQNATLSHSAEHATPVVMVQFLSINFFSWISSIFVGFFKRFRFFVSPCYILKNCTHTSDWEFDLKGPTLRLLSFASTFLGVWEGLSLGVGPLPLSPSRLNSSRNVTMN